MVKINKISSEYNSIQQQCNKAKKVDKNKNESIFYAKDKTVSQDDFYDSSMADVFKDLYGMPWDKAEKKIQKRMEDYVSTSTLESQDYLENTISEMETSFVKDKDGTYTDGYFKFMPYKDKVMQSSSNNGVQTVVNYNVEDLSSKTTYFDTKSGLKQVYNYDPETDEEVLTKYKLDENGEFVETDDYIYDYCTDNGRHLYSGSQLAKILGSQNMNEEQLKEFFPFSYAIYTFRDGGSFEVVLYDDTKVCKDFSMFGESVIRIQKADGTVEKYNPEGNRLN